jgi:uncharacterized membrane protein
MQNLVVITFDGMTEAGNVLASLEKAEDLDFIKLDDTAVVVKDSSGEISVHNEVDRGIKVGVVGGSLTGLLIGLLIGGPIASLVLGAVAGAMGGNLANLGIDQQFIDGVANDLEPSTSAIFMVARDAEPEAVLEVLQPYEGKVYYSALAEETEEELRKVLSDGV